MADEFPALEVAAALGALAAGIRTYQLLQARKAVPQLASQIEAALREGHTARARELCRSTQAAALGSVADALLDALDSADPKRERSAIAAEIKRAIADALSTVRARVQSSRARDLLVALVLVGAIFYATRSGITQSPLFYGLAALGALLAASGFALRPGLVRLVASESDRLLESALGAVDNTRELGGEPCPNCGANETVIVDAPRAFGPGVAKFGLSELRICRRCGYVQGSVPDPQGIPLGAEHGTSLSNAAEEEPEEAAVEAPEHDG